MSTEQITLTSQVLGMNPYLTIEVQPDADPDNGAGFQLRVRAGGGIDSRDDMLRLLLLVVDEFTGVPVDLYVEQVNIARGAAGLPPLNFDE